MFRLCTLSSAALLVLAAIAFLQLADCNPGRRPVSGPGRQTSSAVAEKPAPEPFTGLDTRKKRCDDNSCDDDDDGGGGGAVGLDGGGGGAFSAGGGGGAAAGITCSCTCDGLPLDDDPGSGAGGGGGRHLGFANPWAQNPYRPPYTPPTTPPPRYKRKQAPPMDLDDRI